MSDGRKPGGPRSGPRRSGGPRSGPPRSGPPRSGPPRGGPPRSGAPRRDFVPGAGGKGPRRDFVPGGGSKGPRRDFTSGGNSGPRRDFDPRPSGGSSGPRRDFKPSGPPRRDFKPGGPRRDFKPSGPPRRDFKPGFDTPRSKRELDPRSTSPGPQPDYKPRSARNAPPPVSSGKNEGIRLQALMARAGIASRRESEQMILDGRVTLNGHVVTELGTRAIPGKDHVKVDDRRVMAEERKVYFLFNKPRGVITAVTDPHGRPVVVDYLKVRERVFPVGRLDWDTEGLLILTNDGDLAYKLTHPKFEIPRTYHAKVRGVPDEKTLMRLRRGLFLEDGKARVTKVSMLESTGTNAWLEVIVQEGRNRLVRRIMEAVGHPVQKLKRVQFAGLELGNLKPGSSRALSEVELSRLKHKLDEATPQPPPRGRFAPPPPGFKPDARASGDESGEDE